MATLRPFRALRPRPAVAAAVAAVPYDVVDTDEARALVAGRPLSFLRVGRSEVELPEGTDPHADVVYEQARRALERLRAEAPLEEEAEPSLYVYRLRMGDHVQTGVAGCFSVDEYDADVIKKHERTRKDKEDDRTRHIVTLRAQTGPVFLTYPGRPDVDRLVDAVAAGAPLFDVEAEDGIRHTIWRADAASRDALVAAYTAIPALYIADGHHRAASASRARAALRASDGAPAGAPHEADGFLAVAFPAAQLQVLPYHRVVRDLGRWESPDAFLAALRGVVRVEAGSERPAGPGEVSVYLDGRWHRLLLGPAPAGAEPADRLDVARLQAQVLTPLLDIGDPRTDARIGFVGGIRGPEALRAQVDAGRASVAFAMHPVSVDDLIAVSDAGGIMPPKSTWFEPKLRDGLLSHLI